MNLTIGEVSDLPAPAALFDGDDIIASTPEWREATPGAVTYRMRRARLVVSTDGSAHPACGAAVTALLDEIEHTSQGLPHRQALRVGMLAASLRVVAGRQVDEAGTSTDVLESACAGIASRTSLDVSVCDDRPFDVITPAAGALVLVQLATNAERHDGARSVALRADRGTFRVAWHGARDRPHATSSRRRADRQRWGLGFARIAADSMGAALHPPLRESDGTTAAVLETGLSRLALPLALLRDGVVHKATRAWDEETALLPGCAPPADGRAARSVIEASHRPGAIVAVEGWWARAGASGTWVTIPPDGVVDRARDVLAGMVHERALWDGVPEPGRSRIVALAAIVASTVGADVDRVPGGAWNRLAPGIATAYGLSMQLPMFHGAGAVDPRIVLFLARELGAALECPGDELYLRVRPECRDHPLVRVFPADGDDRIRFS